MIYKKIDDFLALPEETIQFVQLKEDRFFSKIPSEEYRCLIHKASDCGKLAAQRMLEQNPSLSLAEMIGKLGIELSFSEMTVDKMFASVGYFESPNKIIINSKIHEQESFFENNELSWLKYSEWKNIVIAHELFHYFQEQDKTLFINNYKLPLWRIGPYQHKTKLGSLSEIAATAFAKKLLSLTFYPGFLEYLILYPYFPEEIERKIDDVTRMARLGMSY